ncbi:MAG: hypothetical protein HY902_13525 [Deltaproteobacteria bacterium]|nr:hypothetical protein [Deltaproteobacteria bacterium]
MTTDLQPAKTKDDYTGILGKLAHLSRDLLLTFRLEVGKAMLDEYFAGSAHAYHDQNPNKANSFNEFTKTCQEELADYGLNAQLLAQCIRARITWDGLPPPVRDQLRFNHVVALSSVGEPNDRARLAFDATHNGWSVTQLKDAIARVNDHTYYDTDPNTPGTQPPEPMPAPERGYQPGRLVTQLVKTGEDLQTWRAAWATVDAKKLRGPQRQRVVDAVAALEAQVEQLKAELAAGEE